MKHSLFNVLIALLSVSATANAMAPGPAAPQINEDLELIHLPEGTKLIAKRDVVLTPNADHVQIGVQRTDFEIWSAAYLAIDSSPRLRVIPKGTTYLVSGTSWDQRTMQVDGRNYIYRGIKADLGAQSVHSLLCYSRNVQWTTCTIAEARKLIEPNFDLVYPDPDVTRAP